jgi:hypothetical protein
MATTGEPRFLERRTARPLLHSLPQITSTDTPGELAGRFEMATIQMAYLLLLRRPSTLVARRVRSLPILYSFVSTTKSITQSKVRTYPVPHTGLATTRGHTGGCHFPAKSHHVSIHRTPPRLQHSTDSTPTTTTDVPPIHRPTSTLGPHAST